MEAIVFKNHVALTADRAWLVRKHVPGVKVFGGIALNGAAGGLNPQAVEWMWRMQGGYGRVVWFPTFDADNHVRRTGIAPSGIRVVDDRGTVLPAAREVLKVCAAQRLVVQTGHASGAEALALIAAAREEGCDRIVVTHAQFDVVGMTEAQMKEAASMGAKMELCALLMLTGPDAPLEWMRHAARATPRPASGPSVHSTSSSARTSARRATRRPPTACRCSSRDCRPRGSRGSRSRRWAARSPARC
jgi:hypothetical protein